MDGGTDGRRDGQRGRWRDGRTEGRPEGGTEGRPDGGTAGPPAPHTHRQQRLQLLQRAAHEVAVGLGVAVYAVGEEPLGELLELGQLVQQLRVQGLVVVPGRLQLLQSFLVL